MAFKKKRSDDRRKSPDDPVTAATKAASRSTKRVCSFCESKKEPDFTDASSLRKFMSDRARIQPRARTGVCSKHQRRVTKHVKYARHLALLPFVNQI
jgi:small subunit ribosomal protein S18